VRTPLIVIPLAILAMAAAVLYASEIERSVAEENYNEAAAAKQLLVDMLTRGRTLPVYGRTGDRRALIAYATGGRNVRDELATARRLSADDPAELAALDAQERAADTWDRLGDAELRAKDVEGAVTAGTQARSDALVAFQQANGRYQARLAVKRGEELRAAALVPVKLILALGALFGLAGGLFAWRERRRAAAEQTYARSQERFTEALQIAADQGEAQQLLVSHLERTVAGSEIVVFNRNNSADRLEAATALPEDSPLGEPLEHAQPSTCLAVRLSRGYATDADEVLSCDLCGRFEAPASCRPLLVGGEVIGSVLAVHHVPAGGAGARRIDESVDRAAPVLANLRNLAIAETRAATDALTGLANRRAIDDTVKRMVAQAGRAASPLSVIALDLDHFKNINDTHGHERGDEVLAAVGALLRDSLRAGDFAGRAGGEEFIIVLPDTERDGAVTVAEKLRGALEDLRGGLDVHVSASFGIAACPDDAGDAPALLRLADRALYAAKRNGRNRVELATA
jgi:diguanylate cyclase (GGDEF)-like protein